MTDSKSRCVVEISTDTRSIVYLTIDRLSTDYRLTIDQLSTDHRPTIDRPSTNYRPTIDRLSTDRRPTIDRLSTAISTAMSTDISVNITHSKQDPITLKGKISFFNLFLQFVNQSDSSFSLMRVIRDNKELQGVMRGSRGVTREYKRLQGVTAG